MKNLFKLSLLAIILCFAAISFAKDAARDEVRENLRAGTFVPNQGEPQWQPEGAVLFDQSQLVNNPGGGFGGADGSMIESALGHTLFGWGHQVVNTNSMADDFTIPAGQEWNITTMTTWAYQTGSTTTSTITEVRIQIWNGNPMSGGTVIWGDMTTNRMASTTFASIYRTTQADPLNTQRPLMRQVSNIGTTLTAGQYWVQWMSNGTLASGPWCPPVTILGQAVTGDALQNIGGTTWGAALNGTSPNGAPFVLEGAIVPVELTSFAAAVVGSNVELNWSTATEINNQGFYVQRSNGGEFSSVGFVAGHGTTTEAQNYSFVDRNIQVGNYSYRLKQVDFDGTFEYSDVVEIEVGTPGSYSLGQNYPNPFNPSTKISFTLASDSKVSLSVFDVLGQQIMTLVDNELSAGSHEVDFSAAGLNTGVYFYKFEATGNNGSSFNDVKKMILTK
jgi:hypothetical protein